MVRRVFVEKKRGYQVAASHLLADLQENLLLGNLEEVRILNRYDMDGITNEEYQFAKATIFSEPNVDEVYDEEFPITSGEVAFAVEYLPGQYDQRSDSAAQCIQIFTQKEKPEIRNARVYVLKGKLTAQEIEKVKNYMINPVDSREAALAKPESLEQELEIPGDVAVLSGFTVLPPEALEKLGQDWGFAMTLEDLEFCQAYFRDTEKRNPTITEMKLIDTYWSDHCRHTTFLTAIEEVKIEESPYAPALAHAHRIYLDARDYVYGENKKDLCLMDLAVIAMKELRKKGRLEDVDLSEEVNACSIIVPVDVDGRTEEYLVMFKNETHNHPTEIEPFGGAATCLGGAIRDPLSGRSYVYQAMRVTGSADPRTPVEATLPGKLPQRKITREAAAGYSSYGNQIGLATGQVAELYDPDFVAKRMEIGAVMAAAPRENVVRLQPEKGDLIVLVGGRTGRDGCGGATGSSKEHDEDSIFSCGAEVQKGNPPTERKIQRLFRKPEVSRMIKRCNDFGAGGVSVAIGELTDSLEVDLDRIPKKYEGLDGTELAISESQERMAVVLSAADAPAFIAEAEKENVEATVVAKVTDTGRLVMKWRGAAIIDISREFLDTNGVRQKTRVQVAPVSREASFFRQIPSEVAKLNDMGDAWLRNLEDLNVASQKGLVERFDSTIGAGAVTMPLGGKYQLTPVEAMAAKIPVLDGNTTTGTLMSFGYHPQIGKWSPFHGAFFAILESLAKITASGGKYAKARLSLQEYFEKLGKEPLKWGKPYAALLGANYIMHHLGIPAIGGKDSMSGTFKDLHVPPTLVSFAVSSLDVRNAMTPEFKGAGNKVVFLPLELNEMDLPDFARMEVLYSRIEELIGQKKVISAQTVRYGGVAAAISKMCFGNKIGIEFIREMEQSELFLPAYGSFVLEISREEDEAVLFEGISFDTLGTTLEEPKIIVNGSHIDLEEALVSWEMPLEKTFPTRTAEISGLLEKADYSKGPAIFRSKKVGIPRVLVPVFPGTNCEYDMAKAFREAGGEVETLVFRNLKPADIAASLEALTEKIRSSQIVALPGGFSAGDEPDGSGKFIATVFRNPQVAEAVMELLQKRDGLMIGICNGFQALIKLGLVPYGEIRQMDSQAPTLTFNEIGRHISCMSHTRISSNLSPWLSGYQVGEVTTVALSHGEGRFAATEEEVRILMKNGQIAAQYVDLNGNPTYDIAYNPNGSLLAVEALTSPCGRVLGKMGHTERNAAWTAQNVPGQKDMRIFKAGVEYFGS